MGRNARVSWLLLLLTALAVPSPRQDAVAAPERDASAAAGGRVLREFASQGDPDAPVDAGRMQITVASPSRGSASVRLVVPRANAGATGNVLEIFSVDGRRVARRELGALSAGPHAFTLDGTRGLRAGVYFARVRVGGATAGAKFVALP